MKASETLIAWDPIREEDASRLPPVVVGPLIGRIEDPDWTGPYFCTGGAAYIKRRELQSKASLAAVLFDFVMLTVDYGIDPKAVHDAFLVIDEYREAINNHQCGPGM